MKFSEISGRGTGKQMKDSGTTMDSETIIAVKDYVTTCHISSASFAALNSLEDPAGQWINLTNQPSSQHAKRCHPQ
ncbi:hypothetical protein T265_08054 [Opisthorchis viverrini]|uniref:Uncharacterized protein n=1 Tax=Opisthorchis viverrini TaxID=6198 RepID=A0A074ZF54_OPIVI|nr:hypothetical protein T265_08054 [Opisthorchis viverrini]KER24262.1 hypothetical protein T265_08054 [Opisthorchis viverrini]